MRLEAERGRISEDVRGSSSKCRKSSRLTKLRSRAREWYLRLFLAEKSGGQHSLLLLVHLQLDTISHLLPTMDVFRAGEVLLRTPLFPFLAPAAYGQPHTSRTLAPIARRCKGQRDGRQATRAFNTTSCQSQQQAATTSDTRSSPSEFPSTTPRSQTRVTDEISAMLDGTLDLDGKTPTAPTSRTSRFSSPSAQASNPPSRGRTAALDDARPSQGSSLADLGLLFRDIPNSQNGSRRPPGQMGRALSPFDSPFERPQMTDELPAMKLGPSLGRTIQVDTKRGMDVGRAFRTLEQQCQRNRVRADFMRQRFYERPGLKRKRLKSERWRKNFKANFNGTVAMVQKMTRQGW